MMYGIKFENIWHDDDMYEFRITLSDGCSIFVNEVYVSYYTYDETISGLNTFKSQVYGGIYDIEFGSFGPEYASGAIHVRMHFQERGKIHLTLSAQSEFNDFGKKNVASEVVLFSVTEPALLDKFISELVSLNSKNTKVARLEIV